MVAVDTQQWAKPVVGEWAVMKIALEKLRQGVLEDKVMPGKEYIEKKLAEIEGGQHKRALEDAPKKGRMDVTTGVALTFDKAPLHYAAWQGQVEVAKVLVDGQANLEQRMLGGDTPLHQAAWHGHLPMLNFLLSRGASVFALKDDGDTALALSTFRGHLDASRELLRRMTSEECQDSASSSDPTFCPEPWRVAYAVSVEGSK
ncbi:unnamed protein product [Durusdinium trenchii]|uniref:Uncharacterized protein n=1 Tax=Durusdinium trenchii TaxID=1381693 RepID=A0ABP0L285_9DINO